MSIFPGLHPLRGFHPGLCSAAPLGLIFPEILSLSYQASPNGAKDYSQGIHPLVNEAKFCPSPNGAAESPGPHIIPILRMATARSSHRQGHKHVRGTARPATASYFSSIFALPRRKEDICFRNRSTPSGRLFRDGRGMSPRHYWDLRRNETAEFLLLHSDLSMKEIAFHLGYSSQFHFSRDFSRRHTMPPSQFRRRGLV